MAYKTLTIRGARILPGNFRNFKKGRYGYSFCVDLSQADEVMFGNEKIVDPNDLTAKLEDDLWMVQYTKPSSDAYDPSPFLQVKINFDNKFNPPYIVVDGVDFDEKMTAQLQDARFKRADVSISPARPTERRDGTMKRTAYLQSLHVELDDSDGDYVPERYPDPFA